MSQEGENAVAAAVSIEARLRGVTKKHDKVGTWCQLTFEVREDDLETASQIWRSPLGSRWMLAAVEIDDDETALVREKPRQKPSGKAPARKFYTLPLAQQAALRCSHRPFQQFLSFEYPNLWEKGVDAWVKPGSYCSDTDREAIAAVLVRDLCKVKSRADIKDSDHAQIMWNNISSRFIAWISIGEQP